MPAWLAVTVHVPTATSTSVLPLTVQTPGVAEANDTARPDVALATSAAGAVPRVWLPGEAKLIVCAVSGAAATVKLLDTAAAAA